MADRPADEPRSPSAGVGSLAKFFEAQMPTSTDSLGPPGRRQSTLFPSRSQDSSRRSSAIGAPPNWRSPSESSVNVPASQWSSRNASASTLASTKRADASQANVANSNDDMFKRRSVHNSAPSARNSVASSSEEGVSAAKRLSVSRLSMMFDGGFDVHAANRNGVPSMGAHSPGHGTAIPSHSPVQQTLFAGQRRSVSNPASHHPHASDARLPTSPLRNNPPPNVSSHIEVPDKVPVKQRIALLAASKHAPSVAGLQSSRSTSSIYIPRDTPPPPTINIESNGAGAAPARQYSSPVPPATSPASPAFKRRAKPPAVAPSPASQGKIPIPGLDPARFGTSPVLVMPLPPSEAVRRPLSVASSSTSAEAPASNASTAQSPGPSTNGHTAETPPPPSKDAKRENIIRELVTTEKGFLKDMEVLLDVYALPASQTQVLTEKELRNLFSNLDVVISTSRALLEMLEAAIGAPDQWIGEAFNQMMRKLETTYCEYCKHNEAAMAKLAEFASPECKPEVKEFLKDCQAKLQGRTGAWDLGSLVIKPVQRVLKYPLLIKQLLKETPPDHPDFEQLVKAATDIELVAEKINEVKKRKDIVEKYVDGKGNVNVIHGFTKKWTRGTQQFKKATGFVDGMITSDALYDALVEKMDQQQRDVAQLGLHLQHWLGRLKQVFDLQEVLAAAFEDLYALDRDTSRNDEADNFYALQEYEKACVRFGIAAWREADNQVRMVIQPALDVLARKFKEPQVVMRKRDKKLLDYERVEAMKARGEQVDKSLSESASAYSSIHAQLIEELPRFLDLVAKYIDVVAAHIADMQAKVHRDIADNLRPIADAFPSTGRTIIEDFAAAMAPGANLEIQTRSLALLARWREGIWDNGMSVGADPYFINDAWGSGRTSVATNGNDDYMRHSTGIPANLRGRSSPSLFPGAGPMIRQGSSTSVNNPSRLIDHDSPGSSSPTPSSSQYLSAQLQQTLIPSPYSASASAHSSTTNFSRLPSNLDSVPLPPTLSPPPPRTPSPPLGFEAVALYDFEADLVEELDLKEGDIINVLSAEERGGEWWFGVVGDRQGWFPGTYVDRVAGG
ncbi:hypothetical protein BDZ88DRAFT_409187 [Geranomyces variabilis]|nr:hypothetical protein BDZ88DRAFT_409187 [Geranomyces variabilis]KAJ3139855.1 hypothetical protein HDU90_008753 [Geranomyces variabilis]